MGAGKPANGISATASSFGFGVAMIGLVSVSFAIAASAMVACWSLMALVSTGNQTARVSRAAGHLESLRALLGEAEIRERDYLIAGDQNNWQLYQTADDKIGHELSVLETLSRNEALEHQRIATLAGLIRTRISALNDSMQVRAQMGADAALQMLRSRTERSLMDDILRRVDDMIEEQHVTLADSGAYRKISARPVVRIVAGASAAGLVFLALSAILIVRRFLTMRRGLAALSRSDTAAPDQGSFMDAILDSMDAGVVLLDRDLKVIRSNQMAQELLKTHDSQPFEELKTELESASSGDGLTFALEHLQSGLSDTGTSGEAELSVAGPDRSHVTSIAATARAVRGDSGALQGGVLLFRDTTELKSIERELEAREASLIGIFHYGLEAALIATLEDSLCVGVNEGFLRLSGYAREEVIGRPVEELKIFNNPADLGYAIERVRTGQLVRERAPCFSAKQGRAFEATLSMVPIEFSGLSCAFIILGSIEWRPRYFSSMRGLMPSPPNPRRTALALKN
jgi:PAS domain S-box-containing protein